MKIQEFSIENVKPYERNPRKNGDAVEMVGASIEKFGFNVPIIVDEEGVIIAGHTRYLAAKKMGMKTVPVVVAEGLSEDQVRQYRIIDNKTGEISAWDYDKLMMELDAIPEIDMGAFGFGDFSGETDPEEDEADLSTNLDDGFELDLSEYEDEAFDNECPYCGFKWNE